MLRNLICLKMNRIITTALVFLLTGFSAGQKNNTVILETPEYIKPCAKSVPDLNTCLRGTFEHLRPYLIKGIKDINVPSIDPMVIEKMMMENGQGAFRIKAVFSDIVAHGGSNYSIKSIKADLDRYTIEMTLRLPKIDVRGKYDVGGNVLLLPIRSKGDYWAIFVNVDVYIKLNGREILKSDGLKYMVIEKLAVDFKVGKSRFRVRDIVNHGNVIGEAMNQFLNANSQEIIDEMKPAATLSLARFFKTFLNNALLRLPVQVWLPDT